MGKPNLPEWLRQARVSEKVLMVGGQLYTIYILKRELEPRLPGFVGFFFDQFFVASEEIPATWLQFVMSHEIREFTKFKGQPGRCRMALEAELADAGRVMPHVEYKAYVEYRRQFFTTLVAYHATHEDQMFREEIASSLRFLTEHEVG